MPKGKGGRVLNKDRVTRTQIERKPSAPSIVMKKVAPAATPAPKPTAPSDSMSSVVASNSVTPDAIPVPEMEVPEPMADLGDGDDFGDGWGDGGGGGMGGGGKGSTKRYAGLTDNKKRQSKTRNAPTVTSRPAPAPAPAKAPLVLDKLAEQMERKPGAIVEKQSDTGRPFNGGFAGKALEKLEQPMEESEAAKSEVAGRTRKSNSGLKEKRGRERFEELARETESLAEFTNERDGGLKENMAKLLPVEGKDEADRPAADPFAADKRGEIQNMFELAGDVLDQEAPPEMKIDPLADAERGTDFGGEGQIPPTPAGTTTLITPSETPNSNLDVNGVITGGVRSRQPVSKPQQGQSAAGALLEPKEMEKSGQEDFRADKSKEFFDGPIRSNPALSYRRQESSDETRRRILGEVDKTWEMSVPKSDKDADGVADKSEFLFGVESDESQNGKSGAVATREYSGADAVSAAKLKQIVIPEINLKNASLEDALRMVEEKTRELDTTTLSNGRRGVELGFKQPKIEGEDAAEVDGLIADGTVVVPELKLKNVPAETVLKYLGEATKTRYQVGEDGKVTFQPLGASDTADLVQRQWKVPADFMTFLSSGLDEEAPTDDPFAADDSDGGISRIRPSKSMKQMLMDNGAEFPGKASVSFLEDSGTLIVRSTPTQLKVVEALVSAHQEDKAKKEAAEKLRLERENFETSTAVKSDSTFSLNVSDVSFKLAKAALAAGKRPEAEKVRSEEFVNAMNYGDTRPSQTEKISCEFEQGAHPFLSQRNLMRISMSTASLGRNAGTPLRLTLLLDQSGSMERADRVESLKRAFALLAAQLTANDEVTLIGFARTPRLLAERVKGNEVAKLAAILANPLSEGGTNLEEALSSGIQLAKQQFVKGAQNRIILLTDGAANLGDAKPESLAMQVESMRKAGISFDACGVGADGLNDDVLSSLAKKGDGRYYFLDRPEDADEGFARQIAGALRPAAKNVKVQVIFNPERVSSFKLYGFEKHKLKKEDFRNDKVDAAEMAAEESGVALYHFEPNPEGRGDVGTVAVRFLNTSTNQMVERTWVIPYEQQVSFFNEADPKLRLAGVAGLFAERLKGSPVGERVELKRLRQELPALKAKFGSQTRFGELEMMLRQAGE